MKKVGLYAAWTGYFLFPFALNTLIVTGMLEIMTWTWVESAYYTVLAIGLFAVALVPMILWARWTFASRNWDFTLPVLTLFSTLYPFLLLIVYWRDGIGTLAAVFMGTYALIPAVFLMIFTFFCSNKYLRSEAGWIVRVREKAAALGKRAVFVPLLMTAAVLVSVVLVFIGIF